MCVVSNIIDDKFDDWQRRYPWIDPNKHPSPYPVNPPYTEPLVPSPAPNPIPIVPFPSKEELDEFYEALRKAKELDIKDNNPDCGTEEKRRRLLELARQLKIYKKVKRILDELDKQGKA